MRRFLISMTTVLLSSASAVAHAQCAQMTRSGDTVTVSADTWRPLNAIAQTLANKFGIVISAEDPDLVFAGDLTDTTERALPAWRAVHPNIRVYIPKAWRLQVEFRVRQDGTPEDVAALLQQVVVAANAQSPFSYRLDTDGEFNTFVPTRTRDAAGAVVERVPLFDRHIDIPAGTRTIAEDGEMLAKALSAQTGMRISCCQSLVAGVPWGMARVPFEAHDEQARSVLERLVRLEQGAEQQSKQRSFSANSNVYWLLSCDPNAIDGPRYCFIDLHPVHGQCW
ncbi:MAG: hypothetical protein ABR881_26065 [Candidatus Sulfotelmatobacter sp.]